MSRAVETSRKRLKYYMRGEKKNPGSDPHERAIIGRASQKNTLFGGGVISRKTRKVRQMCAEGESETGRKK